MRGSCEFHKLALNGDLIGILTGILSGMLAFLAAGSSAALAQSPMLSPSDKVSQSPAAAELSQTAPRGPDATLPPEVVGDALMIHQRYQAAIEAYRQAPQDSAGVWNKLGIAHQMIYDLEEASRCYQVSLKLNPNNPHVLNNLGTVYQSQKRYGDAERMYRRSIQLNPGSAMAYKNLGTALVVQHNFKQGWAAYQTALTLDPKIFQDRTSLKVADPGSAQDRGAMNYYMARGCVSAGMNDCAIEHLRKALNEGFTDEKKIQADSEFAALRGIPAFDQLLAAQKLQ
jgi:tetratricopeptide (TPR) repeat protein